MKKIIVLIVALFLSFTLSGCESVEITPDKIEVIYNDAWLEDDSLIIEVHLTNGTDEDFDLGYTEFWLELPTEETEVAGAYFEFDIVLKANSYETYELEFESDYVFYDEAALAEVNLTYLDCELYYYIEGLE